jgi:peptide-methionine (S)-S-oxide reductase
MAEIETATFAGGCFWGVQDGFDQLDGVIATEVGYTGGHTDNPSYEDTCGHKTGHAEGVRVDFDPEQVSYDNLLTVFFGMHNPTHVNRQGPDVGDQYRSAIFPHSIGQETAAKAAIAALDGSGELSSPVATTVEGLAPWWRAEEYHQKYFQKTGRSACHI